MRLMAASDDLRFQCYLLNERDDAEAFAHTHWLRGDIRFSELSEGIQQYNILEAKFFLDRTKDKHFVLWDAKERRVIGKTNIKRPIEFTDSLIARESRGYGLADLLYDARLRYMQENTLYPFVFAQIAHINRNSIKAAKRNGFKKSKIFRDFNSAYYFRRVTSTQHDPGLERAREAVFEDPQARGAIVLEPQARPHSLDI